MIKQYKNRKFYCSQSSTYITQEALLKLAKEQGSSFVVTKDGKDVTSKVLVDALRHVEFEVSEILELLSKKDL